MFKESDWGPLKTGTAECPEKSEKPPRHPRHQMDKIWLFFHRVAAKTGFEPPNMDHNGIQESIGSARLEALDGFGRPIQAFFLVVVTHISNPWANHTSSGGL